MAKEFVVKQLIREWHDGKLVVYRPGQVIPLSEAVNLGLLPVPVLRPVRPIASKKGSPVR